MGDEARSEVPLAVLRDRPASTATSPTPAPTPTPPPADPASEAGQQQGHRSAIFLPRLLRSSYSREKQIT
ncbi:unnamed protein product [Urochloa humidicola]